MYMKIKYTKKTNMKKRKQNKKKYTLKKKKRIIGGDGDGEECVLCLELMHCPENNEVNIDSDAAIFHIDSGVKHCFHKACIARLFENSINISGDTIRCPICRGYEPISEIRGKIRTRADIVTESRLTTLERLLRYIRTTVYDNRERIYNSISLILFGGMMTIAIFHQPGLLPREDMPWGGGGGKNKPEGVISLTKEQLFSLPEYFETHKDEYDKYKDEPVILNIVYQDK